MWFYFVSRKLNVSVRFVDERPRGSDRQSDRPPTSSPTDDTNPLVMVFSTYLGHGELSRYDALWMVGRRVGW